jgi:hypothetical protein
LQRRGYHHSGQHQNGEDVHRPRKSPERIKQKTKSKRVIKPKSYREKKEKEFSYFSLIYTFIHNGQDIERLVSGSKS